MSTALALVSAVLAACGAVEPTAPEPVLAKPFEVEMGAAVTLAAEGLRVELEAVSDDSRCPEDVTCVWEGDATVHVKLSRSPARPATLELHTSPRFAQQVKYEGYVVKLVELRPRPRSTQPIAAKDYVAKLEVRRATE